MAGSVGQIFAEIDLDASRYLKSQKKLYQDATQTTLNIEANFKKLGVRSSAEMDLMRQKITNSYNMIANSSKATANDILRAEKAKNEQLKRLNEEQYGAHQSVLSRMRSHWMAYSVAVYAGMRALRATRNEFRDFETALVDMGKVTDRSLDLIRKDIMAINPVLGDATSLMKGYYQTISAGVTDPAKALDLLTTAAKAAKAAHVDQSEVIKALTKMMAGYEGQIRTTEEAADLLFATEKLGQTTVQELVPIIGDISKASKEVGVNQYEMAAALALITQTAGSTSDAATQYKSILMGLLRPNEELTKLIEGQGYASSIAMVQQLGFADALQAIRKQADLTGTQIGKLFRSSEGMLGLASLSADSFRTYKQRIEDVGAGAGSAKKAFDEWKESAEAIDSELGSNFKNTMIEIGTIFAPVWNDVINTLSASFRGLASAIRAARERAQELRSTLPSDTFDLFSVLGGVDTGLGSIEDSGAFRKKIKFGPGSLPPPSVTPTGEEDLGLTREDLLTPYAGYIPFEMPKEEFFMPEALTKEYERIEAERLKIVADFNSQYADLGKSQYDIERGNLDAQKSLWEAAGVEKIRISQMYADQAKKITKEETLYAIGMASQMAGSVADTFMQIAQAGGEASKEAFRIYQAMAIAQAIMNTATLALAGGASLAALPIIGPALAAAWVPTAYAMGAIQIAMIASAKPPSYDEGGISRAGGVYQTGNIDEAHIPLKGGKVPVNVNGGGQTIIIKMENPVFQDVATQRRVFAQIAEVIAKKVAPGAVAENYSNDGVIRKMVRGRA